MENEAQLREAVVEGSLTAVTALVIGLIAEKKLDAAEEAVLDFRTKTEIGGALSEIRQDLARKLADEFCVINAFDRAAVWAVRILLDGPDVYAFKILLTVAEARGDEDHARVWIELVACADRIMKT